MEFRILGPLEVADRGRSIRLEAPKPRALLGVLLLHPNELVSSERLIDELWGERPPATAANVVQIYISQLRRALGAELIATRTPGYILVVDEEALDASRFRQLTADARHLSTSGEQMRAVGRYREALALWRGPPLADVAFASFARNDVERLEEERLGALTARIDCELALGQHHELAAELETLVRQHPLRERLRAQLMLALYRTGRQADALAAYQDARSTLIDELGLEPTRELQDLEKAILTHDVALQAPAAVALTEAQAPAVPTGTVTFLFTDIERSTDLVRLLGDAYAALLAGHRRLLRKTLGARGGYEVDYQGDASFFSFARARDAVGAAVDVQRALAQSAQSGGAELRIRIGIHTGEPGLSETGYHGLDVVRAARIAAAAHGGQTLVSAASRTLLGDEPLQGVVVRDLGEHRLKDFPQAERIYQVSAEALDRDFPPVRPERVETLSILTELARTHSNLPPQATPFFGRTRELAQVLTLLRRADVRLLTLTGPGGSGKTRLALQAAADLAGEYEHGVWWVPLAALQEPELVLEATAQALGAKQQLAEHIADKRLLLLLDNFEHLLAAAVGVGVLLAACPRLDVFVTSRERLHLAGEHVYPVPPLVEAEAVDFFLARARAVRPDLAADATVPEICRRLEGLPLALELAAARVLVLSPAAILGRLERRLPLLTGGPRDAPERQRTLQATIEWSYDLLAPEEQRLFARLSIFASGFTLEAAEVAAGADLDTLQSLVDRSLLRRDGDRCSMLETIREFALGRLEASGEADEFRRRHAHYFLELALRHEPDFRGPRQLTAVERIEPEHENFRSILEWARETRQTELALRLTVALSDFWALRNYFREGRRWLELAAEAGEGPVELRAHALRAASAFCLEQGDMDGGEAFARAALELYRSTEDAGGIASALHKLAEVASVTAAYDRAESLYEESRAFAREAGNRDLLGNSLIGLADLALHRRSLARAAELSEESLAEFRELGDLDGIASSLSKLGFAHLLAANLEEAIRTLSSALGVFGELRHRKGVARALIGLAAVAADEGTHVRAARLLGAAQDMLDETGYVLQGAERHVHEATIAAVRQELASADFTAELARGKIMGFHEIIEFSLQDAESGR